MKKFLVISDTHRNTMRARRLIEHYQCEINGVWHLGDLSSDMASLSAAYYPRYPHLAFAGINGNCDYDPTVPEERLFRIEDCKVFMTHGHRYMIRYSTDFLAEAAREKGANIVLYGHSHIPLLKEEGGLMILNPGSLSEPRGGSPYSYAILTIDGFRASAKLYDYSTEFPGF